MVDAYLNQASLSYAESFTAEDEVTTRARGRAGELGCTPIGPAGGATLRLLAAAAGARSVVEVGTGAGVSGLYLLGGMATDGVLTTIDLEGEHQRAAKDAFGEAGVAPTRYRLINGSASEVLPFGEASEEVHSTITRAWLLFQRTQREELAERLDKKHARLREALLDLRATEPRLYAAATYRVAPNKRSPREHRKLVELGLVTLPGAQPKADAPTGAEARRLVKAVAGGARLEGLFPREMRVPTNSPPRKVWPDHEPSTL